MGTHPIFESDFDCLTDMNIITKRALCLELRTYALKPSSFGNYIKLSNDKFHLRTAHSKLNGFWIHDLGGLNAVTHLWEYDSLAHRAQIRANLAADPEWISDYVTHLTPMLAQDVNSCSGLEEMVKSSEHAKRGRLVNCLVDDIGR